MNLEHLKITVARWVMTTERAGDALHALTTWNRNLGVWCACYVAKELLQFVPAEEVRPLRAIEVTESLVRRQASTADVVRALEAANDCADAALTSYLNAAPDAMSRAVLAACDAAAIACVVAVADDVRSAADGAAMIAKAAHEAYGEAEQVRLREVISNACLTFPG